VTRILSAVVLLATVGSLAWFASSPVLLGVAMVVAVLAFDEFRHLAGRLGARVPPLAAGTATAAACAATAVPNASVAVVLLATLVVVGAIAVSTGRPEAARMHDVAASVLAPVYVGMPLGALVAVHWLAGRDAALLLIAVIVSSDTGQYYAGRLFGRRPLAPVISPKKTIEGAIGGLLLGSAVMVVAGHWWLPGLAPGLRLGLGLTVVALGITGDLFESLLKRAAGVKDSSALIPGHGGVLDRIDALLFASPVYYAVVIAALGAVR
jgi:phosphatidate cytidylyltransferase